MDADASQNYAINAVLAGQDLIIKGPPGTGKSQTIANLVSTLVARGKRVLFVAEKRAAIDAVLKRLTDVGLGDLVLDLHGGVSSRRKVARVPGSRAGARTPDWRGPTTTPSTGCSRPAGRSSTPALRRCMRSARPWRLSYFDAQSRLLGLDPTAATPVRFRGPTLSVLNEQAMEAAADHLRVYAGLGGLTLPSSGSPWAGAEVVSAEQAHDVQALVDRLRHHTLPLALERVRAAAGQTHVRPPTTIDGWARVLSVWAGRRCDHANVPGAAVRGALSRDAAGARAAGPGVGKAGGGTTVLRRLPPGEQAGEDPGPTWRAPAERA